MSRWRHHRDGTLRGNYLGGSSQNPHFPALARDPLSCGDRNRRMFREFACQPIDEYSYAKRELSPMRIEKRRGGRRWSVLRKKFDEGACREIGCDVIVR